MSDTEYRGYTIRTGGGSYLVLTITEDVQGNPDEFCHVLIPVSDGLPAVEAWIDDLIGPGT